MYSIYFILTVSVTIILLRYRNSYQITSYCILQVYFNRKIHTKYKYTINNMQLLNYIKHRGHESCIVIGTLRISFCNLIVLLAPMT